jgi:hypothetical protein
MSAHSPHRSRRVFDEGWIAAPQFQVVTAGAASLERVARNTRGGVSGRVCRSPTRAIRLDCIGPPLVLIEIWVEDSGTVLESPIHRCEASPSARLLAFWRFPEGPHRSFISLPV